MLEWVPHTSPPPLVLPSPTPDLGPEGRPECRRGPHPHVDRLARVLRVVFVCRPEDALTPAHTQVPTSHSPRLSEQETPNTYGLLTDSGRSPTRSWCYGVGSRDTAVKRKGRTTTDLKGGWRRGAEWRPEKRWATHTRVRPHVHPTTTSNTAQHPPGGEPGTLGSVIDLSIRTTSGVGGGGPSRGLDGKGSFFTSEEETCVRRVWWDRSGSSYVPDQRQGPSTTRVGTVAVHKDPL